MVFDTAIDKLKERISDKASPVIQTIDLLVAGWRGEDVPEEQLNLVTAFYGNDLERDRLRAEIVTLENIHEHDERKRCSYQGNNQSSECQWIKENGPTRR